jgi:hypothetical protein
MSAETLDRGRDSAAPPVLEVCARCQTHSRLCEPGWFVGSLLAKPTGERIFFAVCGVCREILSRDRAARAHLVKTLVLATVEGLA